MHVIQKFIKNSLRNYNYIIASDSIDYSVFVDPFDLDQTLPLLNGRVPRYLLNTHQHHDHIKDNERFLKIPGTQLVILDHGESLNLTKSETIKSIYTPGHVDNHFCFFLYQEDMLTGIIVGDTVFNCGVGNCKNGGNPQQLAETIRDIFHPLPDEVKIYPSHDYFLTNLKFAETVEPENLKVKQWIAKRESMDLNSEFLNTTIGQEREINPFFRVFDGVYDKKFPHLNRIEIFKLLRSKRDNW